MPEPKLKQRPLPPPWDRLFSLGSRIFVWGLIAAIIYILRPFFLLVFLTFVFAYIQTHGVNGLQHRIPTRWVRVVLVFLVFLGTLIAIGVYLRPHIEHQVITIAEKLPGWIDVADKKIEEFATQKKIPISKNFNLTDVVNDVLGLGSTELFGNPSAVGQANIAPPEGASPVVPGGAQGAPAAQGAEDPAALKALLEKMRNVATWLLAIGSAFLLSLLFSFLIVLDLPKLARGVQGLAHTKIGFIYAEVADNVYHFCKVLGRAMEAQLFIAICNTVLTAIGLSIIGLGQGSLVFLCTIVFLCSFIPVAGVFISSTPICIVALSEHGFGMLGLAIGVILVIHFIEAYFLNPKIYGHHLRMNPVLTLIILTVCGKLFGPWGLILGIPVMNYIFAHAIRTKQARPPEFAGAA